MTRIYRHIFALMLFVAIMISNDTMAQANIWLGGGVNFSKMRKVYADEAFSNEDDVRAGFNLNFSLQQNLGTKLDIVSGVSYDTKGYVTKMDDNINTVLYFTTHYLDFYPTSLLFFHTLKEQSRVYAITGPYLGVGLFGKERTQDDNGSIEEDVDWTKLELERFDLGWNFGIGYDFKQKVQCELGYDMGLKNITDNTNKYLKLRNNAIKLTVKVSLSQLLFPLFKSGKDE